MPIRRELRPLYPAHWRELSRRVRFDRAAGACEGCGRPHGLTIRCVPDGRWFDPGRGTWRDRRGRPARWPDLEEMTRQYTTRVVLAAAHLDNDPGNNRLRNLRSLCQRCHLIHDRAWHLLQRWITYRLRYARGDLFLGPYRRGRSAVLVMNEILTRITQQLSAARPPLQCGQARIVWKSTKLVGDRYLLFHTVIHPTRRSRSQLCRVGFLVPKRG